MLIHTPTFYRQLKGVTSCLYFKSMNNNQHHYVMKLNSIVCTLSLFSWANWKERANDKSLYNNFNLTLS